MVRALADIFAPQVMVMLCLLSWPVVAGNTESIGPSPPASQAGDQAAVLLPTISLRADASGNDLFDALQTAHLFAHLSKEAPGSPIQLRIYHSVHPANVDAKNFFSGMLSVGTLGLSPVVTTTATTAGTWASIRCLRLTVPGPAIRFCRGAKTLATV